MPKVDLIVNVKLKNWLYLLAGSQLAVDEQGDTYTGITAASISMKLTMHSLILHTYNDKHDGVEGLKSIRLFSFASPKLGGAIMVYVNSIQANFDDGTVIIDAAVCVLTDEKITCNVRTVAPWFQHLEKRPFFLMLRMMS